MPKRKRLQRVRVSSSIPFPSFRVRPRKKVGSNLRAAYKGALRTRSNAKYFWAKYRPKKRTIYSPPRFSGARKVGGRISGWFKRKKGIY